MPTRIFVGDVSHHLATIRDDTVDCCVTSPPYWGLRDYGHENQIGLEPTYQIYVDRLVAVFREVRRVLKPTGTLWLNLGEDDPHGLFEHVRSVWMTTDYVEASEGGAGDEWLRDAFPETRQP